MTISNEARSGQILSISLLLDGTALRDTYDLLSLEVERAVNEISKATITILLPRADASSKAFEDVSEARFLPGTTVDIQVGYTELEGSIYQGIIVGQSLQSSGEGRPTLRLRCQDKAIVLTGIPKRHSFPATTDSSAIKEILTAAGLEADVDATEYEHEQLVQYALSDWDFLVSRAEGNGMIVSNTDGKVSVAKPAPGSPVSLFINYDTDVLDFRGDLDTTAQYTTVTARNWDYQQQDYVENWTPGGGAQVPGVLSPKKIAGMLGDREYTIESSGSTDKGALKNVAEAVLSRSRHSSFRGTVTCFGTKAPTLNTLIDLEGFGERFDGKAIISRIRHSVREGIWRTEIGFGLSPELYGERHPELFARGKSRLYPTVSGTFHGQVITVYGETEHAGQIQVRIPALNTEVWARQASFYATKEKGAFFAPEKDDEVIVSFVDDDPQQAVILGSLNNPKHAAPYLAADDENAVKGLQTRSGIKLEMDDNLKVLTITTPGGNQLLLSDDDESITLTDQNGNELCMNKDGISLSSPGAINVTASEATVVKGTQGVQLESSGGDIGLKGLNVNAEGQVAATLKGKASAEISAAGQTTVKGAMVMIN